jgi:hypothetical protein
MELEGEYVNLDLYTTIKVGVFSMLKCVCIGENKKSKVRLI